MKKVLGIIILGILLTGCYSSRISPNVKKSKNLVVPSEEKEEYEVVILDPGFESWFATAWSPAQDRSLQYYSNWNNQYVLAWNDKVRNPRSSQFFDTIINYDPTADYGMEVERKLYYYFRWVETQLNLPILNRALPRGVL